MENETEIPESVAALAAVVGLHGAIESRLEKMVWCLFGIVICVASISIFKTVEAKYVVTAVALIDFAYTAYLVHSLHDLRTKLYLVHKFMAEKVQQEEGEE
jgi:hypothetical protein